MDDLIEHILEKNRRLVSVEGRVLLRDASPTEAMLIASISTAHAAARIRSIQKRQDGLISELQRVLEKEPTRVRIVRSSDGAERLSLQVDRPDLQRAFRSWAFEPDVKPFVQRAVECNKEAARVKKERETVERAIEQVTVTAIPIQRGSDGSQPRFALDQQFLLELGLVAKDLSSPLVQRLLAQAHEVQTNDVQRLAGFAGKFPGRIVPGPDAGEGEVALIISKGPPDLQSLALRYRHHPSAQQALRTAVASNLALRSTAVTPENKVGAQYHSEAHRAAAAMPSRQGKE